MGDKGGAIYFFFLVLRTKLEAYWRIMDPQLNPFLFPSMKVLVKNGAELFDAIFTFLQVTSAFFTLRLFLEVLCS